jgi:hypothetical protein
MIAMEAPDGKAEAAERNRQILARTAGIVSWLYAAERTLVGLALFQSPGGSGIFAHRAFGTLCLAHAVLLLVAGAAFVRDRRWAWGPGVLAAAGAVFLAVLMALKASWANVAVDGAYALVVAAVLARRRQEWPDRKGQRTRPE